MWAVGLRTLTVSVAAVGVFGGMSVLSTSGCEQKRSQSVWMSGFKENAGMCITTETQGNISHSFSVSNTDLN